MSKEQQSTVDQAASLARVLFAQVVSPRRLRATTNNFIHTRVTGSKTQTSARGGHKHSSGRNLLHRDVHGKGSRATKDCHVLNSALAKHNGRVPEAVSHTTKPALSKKFDRTARYRCEAPTWRKGHVCENKKTTTMAIRGSSLANKENNAPTPSGAASDVPMASSSGPEQQAAQAPDEVQGSTPSHEHEQSTPSFADGVDLDELLKIDVFDEDITMATIDDAVASACNNCKSFDISSYSSQNTDSFYVPITIEDAELWALVNTGTTFSAISPRLCKSFGWSLVPRTGTIHLASSSTTIKRIGQARSLNIFFTMEKVLFIILRFGFSCQNRCMYWY